MLRDTKPCMLSHLFTSRLEDTEELASQLGSLSDGTVEGTTAFCKTLQIAGAPWGR